MTTHESNEGLGARSVRTRAEALNERDRDKLLAVLAEDISWHGPLQGTLHGRDEVWERFYAPLWEAPARGEVHDILDNGEHVVVLGEAIIDLPEGTRSWKSVEVCHYNDHGQITERWAFVEHEQEFIETFRP